MPPTTAVGPALKSISGSVLVAQPNGTPPVKFQRTLVTVLIAGSVVESQVVLAVPSTVPNGSHGPPAPDTEYSTAAVTLLGDHSPLLIETICNSAGMSS